jgi:hypothetical protein
MLWDRACDKDGLNLWMSEVVVLLQSGSMLMGDYDGYGRVCGVTINDEPEAYHRACWEAQGKPTEFASPSEGSDDQGWFFDDGAHSVAQPRVQGV